MRNLWIRSLNIILVLCLVSNFFSPLIGQSSADELTNRSVTISNPTPSVAATHTFQLRLASAVPIGSIVFQYCSNSPLITDSCTAPLGLSLSGAVLSQQAGNVGFVIDTIDSTASRLVISRPLTSVNQVANIYTFSNIVNPSADNATTYVRISTYASTQGTGSIIDNGSVAFATSSSFAVGAYIPPFLSVCVGVTVTVNCSQATGFGLDFGDLSSQTTRSVTSQYSASTNDPSGLSVYLLGTTMTSGNNLIPQMSPQPSQVGTSEFGINLRQNTNPAVGADPTGGGTAFPTSNYNTPNVFAFTPGAEIANSTIPTSYTLTTVSYIVNVSSTQPPGVYNTTLTYLVSVQF
jgi:hypothetical protein